MEMRMRGSAMAKQLPPMKIVNDTVVAGIEETPAAQAGDTADLDTPLKGGLAFELVLIQSKVGDIQKLLDYMGSITTSIMGTTNLPPVTRPERKPPGSLMNHMEYVKDDVQAVIERFHAQLNRLEQVVK